MIRGGGNELSGRYEKEGGARGGDSEGMGSRGAEGGQTRGGGTKKSCGERGKRSGVIRGMSEGREERRRREKGWVGEKGWGEGEVMEGSDGGKCEKR